MIEFVLLLLVIFWIIGFIHVPFLGFIFFSIARHPFTLHNFLLLVIIIAIISLLPKLFKFIAGVILLLWLLSLIGVIALAGFSHLLIILLIAAVIFSLI